MHITAHVGKASAKMEETEAAGMRGRVLLCSVCLCKHGSVRARSMRTVAYDSSYEDNQDGWLVVGGDKCCDWTDRTGRTDKVDEVDGGRFDSAKFLAVSEVPDDEFFECDCDNADFKFEIRRERRGKQQERRKLNGQKRNGRTVRKRAVAVITEATTDNAAAMSVSTRKRLCWLRAKLQRTVVLCQAV